VFRGEWSREQHDHLPHVVVFADAVVRQYAHLNGITPLVDNADRKCEYLLVENIITHAFELEPVNSIRLVAHTMRQVINQFEKRVQPTVLTRDEDENIQMITEYEQRVNGIDESYQRVRRIMDHWSQHEHLRHARMANHFYSFTIPSTTLYLVSQGVAMRQGKHALAAPAVATLTPTVVTEKEVKKQKRGKEDAEPLTAESMASGIVCAVRGVKRARRETRAVRLRANDAVTTTDVAAATTDAAATTATTTATLITIPAEVRKMFALQTLPPLLEPSLEPPSLEPLPSLETPRRNTYRNTRKK
jgi:hypothetical protein